jgi:site-specific DNA recombinase
MATQTKSKSILEQFTVLERAITYSRVSGDDSKKDSIKSQLDMGRDYCQQKGYRIVEEMFEDPKKHTSGYDIDLPVLNQIIEMAHAGQLDVLVVRELDRLSRSLAKQLIIEEKLKRAGVRVEYVLESYADSAEGRLQKHIKATVAEYEREKIKERMARGRRERAKSGFVVPTGPKPYGYKSVKRENERWYLEVCEDEARIVRLIFEWYIGNQEMTLQAIANRLNEMDIPTRSKKVPWRQITVRCIIVNETYAGVWYYGKRGKQGYDPIPVNVPPIVEREVWELAQAKLPVNRQMSKRNRKRPYLFANRLRCGDCGYSIVGTTAWEEKYKYYRCCSKTNAANCDRDCHNLGFRVEVVDTKIWDRLEAACQDEDKLRAGLQGYQAGQEAKVEPMRGELALVEEFINKKTAEWKDEIRNMNHLISDNAKAVKGHEIDEIEKLLVDLKARKAKLLAQLEVKDLTDQQITSIIRSARRTARDMKTLRTAEHEGVATPELRQRVYEGKRKLLAQLDVQVTLFVENGKRKALLTAKFCPEGLLIDFNNINIDKIGGAK